MHSLGEIRDIRDTELELMLSWRNAPSARQNMYTRHVISLEEHLGWWDKTKVDSRHRYFMYAYESKPFGIVGFNNIDTVNKNSSWAFYASPDAPRGTGSRMEFLALDHAFDNLSLHKLFCEVLAFNEPVIKLHKKFGFEVEGVFKEHHLGDDGFVDVYRLGLLASQWRANRESMHNQLSKMMRAPS